ncbi:MAG TPA: DUF3786 domain-containing protein [Nitrospirota bacterium]|nr:DUF3786 domain-containing protein [Nitrospirota bacterium]
MKALEQISFPKMAKRICALYSEDEDALRLNMLGQEYIIRHDGVYIRGQKAPDVHATVLSEYLFSPGKEPIVLPWRAIGDFAAQASPDFRKKVEAPLTANATEIIGRTSALFPMMDAEASSSIIGSDLAFTVHALPKVYLHVEISGETEDFPAEAWLLFSNNANEFLSVQGLYALAEMFKDRLLSLIRIY